MILIWYDKYFLHSFLFMSFESVLELFHHALQTKF
jgi:hypothetical protein